MTYSVFWLRIRCEICMNVATRYNDTLNDIFSACIKRPIISSLPPNIFTVHDDDPQLQSQRPHTLTPKTEHCCVSTREPCGSRHPRRESRARLTRWGRPRLLHGLAATSNHSLLLSLVPTGHCSALAAAAAAVNNKYVK